MMNFSLCLQLYAWQCVTQRENKFQNVFQCIRKPCLDMFKNFHKTLNEMKSYVPTVALEAAKLCWVAGLIPGISGPAAVLYPHSLALTIGQLYEHHPQCCSPPEKHPPLK